MSSSRHSVPGSTPDRVLRLVLDSTTVLTDWIIGNYARWHCKQPDLLPALGTFTRIDPEIAPPRHL